MAPLWFICSMRSLWFCNCKYNDWKMNYLEIQWRLQPHGKAVTGNAESYELEQLSSYPLHSVRPFLEWQWYLADSCRPTTSWSSELDAVYAYKICCNNHWLMDNGLGTIARQWWQSNGSLKSVAWYKYDRHSVMWCRGGHRKMTALQNS